MTTFFTKALSITALIAGLVSASAATAAPVGFNFEVTVESIGADDLNFFAPAGITVGSTISGSFEYDDAETNRFEFTSNFDSWTFTSFATEFGDGSPFEIEAASLDPGQDWWLLAGTAPVGASTFPLFVQFFVQGDFGFSSIVGPGLGKPIQGPPVLDGLSASLSYGGPSGEPLGVINGSAVFSRDPTPIPLPASFPLLAGGLGVLAAMRRVRLRAVARALKTGRCPVTSASSGLVGKQTARPLAGPMAE